MTDASSASQRFLRRIEPLIYARRWVTMGVLLAITLLLAWQMFQIKRDAGFDKSIPLEHPYMKVLKQYQAEFGGANTVLVALIGKDGANNDIYNGKFLAELKIATDEVFFLPGIDRSRVSSLFTPDVRFMEVVEGGFTGGNVVPADYAPSAPMLQAIRENVGKAGVIGRYVTNDQRGAMISAELLEIDPISGEKLDYEKVAHQLEDKLRGRFESPQKYVYKMKTSRAPFAAGEVVYEGFVDYGWKLWLQQFDVVKKRAGADKADVFVVQGKEVVVEAVPNPQYDPNVSVHIIGFAKIVGDVIDATLEVVLFFMLTLVLTGLLLWLYTGNLKLAMLPLVCSITAVTWEFGLLRFFGFGLDPFAILVPFLILAVSVSHGVQYVNAWVGEIAENGRSSFDASLETWRRLAVYGTMAIMTDVVGFLTIYLIPIDIIREMSINATLGMTAIIITNKVMMPIWLTWVKVGDPRAFREKQERRDSIFDPIWRLLSFTTQRAAAATIIVLCGVVLGWAIWKGQWLQIGDSQAGVPELLPDSRYNRDSAAIGSHFAIGSDVLKVIAETDADACADFEVMDQVDRFAWRMHNTAGVRSTLSLPEVGKQVNAAFNEASPKFRVLPRNKYVMVQAITPVPTSSGLLNGDCSALAVLAFTRDHRAATLDGIVGAVKQFNDDNQRQFFEDHRDVESGYCEGKLASRREIGATRTALQRATEKLKKRGFGDEQIAADANIRALSDKVEAAADVNKNFGKTCPVNFALASANIGVMAATNEEVHRLEKRTLLIVYAAIVFCVFVSFFEWESIVCIMLPLGLVSWSAYAVMAKLGIGLKVATLPVVALAVGIGVDYGIYIYATMADAVHSGFGMREAYYKTLKMTGKAVIFTGITLALGVFTWMWSGLQFQRDMGKLLVFMFTANMFGAILVLPAIASFLLKERALAPGEKPVFKPRH
jgi:predicted RND superfamily exporter protein